MKWNCLNARPSLVNLLLVKFSAKLIKLMYGTERNNEKEEKRNEKYEDGREETNKKNKNSGENSRVVCLNHTSNSCSDIPLHSSCVSPCWMLISVGRIDSGYITEIYHIFSLILHKQHTDLLRVESTYKAIPNKHKRTKQIPTNWLLSYHNTGLLESPLLFLMFNRLLLTCAHS